MRPELKKLLLRSLIATGVLSTLCGIVIFAIFANGWLLSAASFSSLEESYRVAMTYLGISLITFGLTLGLILPLAQLTSVIESKKAKNSSSKHQQIQAFNEGVLKQHSSRRFLLENETNSTEKVKVSPSPVEDDIESSISKKELESRPQVSPRFGPKYSEIELSSTKEEMKVANVNI
jgi:hypothetical protein